MHDMHTVSANGDAVAELFQQDPRLNLRDKVACITGAAQGIGLATAVELAREGARAVAAVDFSEKISESAKRVNGLLEREALFAFRGDTCDAGFRRSVFQEMRDRVDHISICVPAAGITRDRLAVKVSRESGIAEVYPEEDFRRVIDVDLTAPIYWAIQTIASIAEARAKAGLKRWTPSEPVQGCVIFIGSVSSTGNKGQISYATAKAGLEGAAATLASEAAFYGVRSAIIHPGYTDTGMVSTLGEEFIARNILPQTQLGRLIEPKEIAQAIVFMIRNSAVSGKVWVDAGWHPAV